jgi:spore maturation protein B
MEKIQLAFQYIIPFFIFFTVAYGFAKKTPVYESFVSGAKEGIDIIIGIFPYVLAIFIMVKTFQASGAHDFFKGIFASVAGPFGLPAEVFSIGLVKPMSNAAALGIFTEILKTHGPDSLTSTIAAVIMGSAETTFYVIAVYLGSVGIRKSKYLVPVCLSADLVGIIVAVLVVKLIF